MSLFVLFISSFCHFLCACEVTEEFDTAFGMSLSSCLLVFTCPSLSPSLIALPLSLSPPSLIALPLSLLLPLLPLPPLSLLLPLSSLSHCSLLPLRCCARPPGLCERPRQGHAPPDIQRSQVSQSFSPSHFPCILLHCCITL